MLVSAFATTCVCTADAVENPFDYSPSERWKALDADNAWKEVIDKWVKVDKESHLTFVESVQQTLKMGANLGCETLKPSIDNCDGSTECEKGLDGPNSGPAGQLIWTSLIRIHAMHHGYWDSLEGMTGSFALSADDMEDTFAPIPEPETNQWLNILIDILTIGTLTTAAPFFNNFLKKLPAFANPTTFDNAKDISLNLVGQSTTLAKDMLESPAPDSWTPGEQNKFSTYVAQVIFGWMNTTELAVGKLFDGSSESFKALGDAMADGNLIEGKRDRPEPDDNTATELRANVLKSFFGFAIPTLWRRSKAYAFVLDSGSGCDGRPSSKYVSDSTAHKTGVCYQGRQYYLVEPEGSASNCVHNVCIDNEFSAPPGIDDLGRFGRITKEDLVIGSVRTWRANGNENGGKVVDPINGGSVRGELVDLDITAPGYVRLPVCSGDRAYQSWDTSSEGSSTNYPCDVPPGIDHCRVSTFEDRTSDASPSVSDCRQIIRNIEGDGKSEWTHRITGHREILKYGSCAFGIERTGGTGGQVEFQVGGQDVVDIINDSISKYGGDGRVGAMGVMNCKGTTSGRVNVEWGIY